MKLGKSLGFIQVPLLIGLLLIVGAIPLVTNLMKTNLENRGKATGELCLGNYQCKTATNDVCCSGHSNSVSKVICQSGEQCVSGDTNMYVRPSPQISTDCSVDGSSCEIKCPTSAPMPTCPDGIECPQNIPPVRCNAVQMGVCKNNACIPQTITVVSKPIVTSRPLPTMSEQWKSIISGLKCTGSSDRTNFITACKDVCSKYADKASPIGGCDTVCDIGANIACSIEAIPTRIAALPTFRPEISRMPVLTRSPMPTLKLIPTIKSLMGGCNRTTDYNGDKVTNSFDYVYCILKNMPNYSR